MSELPTELLILFLLLLVNGVLAMAEIAVVSARKVRLKRLADNGNERAKQALAIATDPARFLSTVQVGITLVGVLAGAFGGATISGELTSVFDQFPAIAPYAHSLALGVVVVAITLCSVVIGELVPKRLGLHHPEFIAILLIRPINVLSRIVSPLVSILTWVTNLLLAPFGRAGQPKETPVSDEEVNILIAEGLHAGVFNQTETEMVAGVLELDKLSVTAIMTPRPKIVFLNIDDPEEGNWRKIVTSGHSHFPVYQGNRDQILGMVSVKAIWANSAFGLSTHLKNLLVPPVIVPETMMAITLLQQFQKNSQHIALVADEFGSIQGLVSLIDVFEAIVGDIPQRGQRSAPEARQREDGSWLIDATLATADLKAMLKLSSLPHENEADFQTLGGFVMTHFGRIPRAGDYFDHAGWRFEVVDMDRHRVDKVLVGKIPAAAAKTVA
ncbi:MAG: HlyC/CorC family transporter [Verrucomicrobia bacterium]|nr:HlyC/CorC family transporter [Verrucomicrobiota bacterium]